MQEWSNKYNSFNSMKGLMYVNEFEGIVKGKLLPPIEALIAPNAICNSKCIWCNSKETLEKYKGESIDPERMKRLITDWIDWGVKGYCWSGDGESTLYPAMTEMLYFVRELGGENAIITNGVHMPDDLKMAMVKTCNWIGVSLDAASPKTWAHVKGIPEENYYKMIDNVTKLVKMNKKVRISMKFLLHPDNCHEVYDACMLAKKIGVLDFHVRPVCTEGFYDVEHRTFTKRQIKSINKQLEKCFKEETPYFRVYGVKHKFSEDLQVLNNFQKCWAAPLLLITTPEGLVYHCIEQRGNPKFALCALEDIRKFWGSKEHLDLLHSICPEKECTARCTMNNYNEQVEQCIIYDNMCRRFP